MAVLRCARCGTAVSDEVNFCPSCGAQVSIVALAAVRLSTARLVVLSVLSGGLYLFYWFFITWKQLRSETRDQHYPIWHALTLMVPIYSFFRMHRHLSVISELAGGANISKSLSPGAGVVMLVVISAIDWSTLDISNMSALILLSLISVALTTALIVSAQDGLNEYWERSRGPNLQDLGFGVGEFIIVALGILFWTGTFLPA